MNLEAVGGMRTFFQGGQRRRALYSTPAVSRAPFFSRSQRQPVLTRPVFAVASAPSVVAPVIPKTATKVRIVPGGEFTSYWKGRFMHMNEPQSMGAYFSRRQLSSRYVRPRGREVFRFHGLGATPDYGAMLMNPTTPGMTPPFAPPQPSWLTSFTEIAKQALPVYQQAKILREQQKRRAAGLPPLESEQLAPTVRVQGGLDPGTMQLGKMALMGGLAIGGGLLLMTVMRKR